MIRQELGFLECFDREFIQIRWMKAHRCEQRMMPCKFDRRNAGFVIQGGDSDAIDARFDGVPAPPRGLRRIY